MALTLAVWWVGVAAFAGSGDESDPNDLPWELRNFYEIKTDNGTLTYAVDNGQWGLEISGVGTVIGNAHSSVTLGDGKVIQTTGVGSGSKTRDVVTTELGRGSAYGLELPARDGLAIRHSIVVPVEFPFYMVRLEVTNVTDAPIEIRRISPVVLGAGELEALGPEVQARHRRFRLRGRHLTYDPLAPSVLTTFTHATQDFTLALGSFPSVGAESGLELRPYGGAWQGHVGSTFDPPRRLKPGESLSADPVLLSFIVADPAEVDRYYTWAHARSGDPAAKRDVPKSWVTVEEGESAEVLAETAKAWNALGVKHVLVPPSWEVLPGTLQGVSPSYPRSMAKLASRLKAANSIPGLSVNPLAVQGGARAWTAVSADGQRWLNVATAEGRAYGLKQMACVASWGYEFFVVHASHIPDEILVRFALTRVQADAIALEIVAEAVGNRPVLPGSAASLRADGRGWSEAAAATTSFRAFEVPMGPVRFDARVAAPLPDETVSGMAAFAGPIEFLGIPRRNVQSGIERVLAARRVQRPSPIRP